MPIFNPGQNTGYVARFILKYYVYMGMFLGNDGCEGRREAITCLCYSTTLAEQQPVGR